MKAAMDRILFRPDITAFPSELQAYHADDEYAGRVPQEAVLDHTDRQSLSKVSDCQIFRFTIVEARLYSRASYERALSMATGYVWDRRV